MITGLSRLASRHHRRVLVLAAVVFLAGVALGLPVLSILKTEQTDFEDPAAQSQQVLRIIERATGEAAYFGVAALVPSDTDIRANPAGARSALRVASLLAGQAGFQRVLDYPASRLPQLVSLNGRQTVVLAAFATRKDSEAAVAQVRPRLAGSGVLFGGDDITFSELEKTTTSDLKRAETLALPILLVLSFLVFRGLIAAALPLLVGGFAIVTTFLILRIVDQFTGLSIFALNLVSGMGLGLGIDYSLFVLSRYREELARGADTPTAISRTLQTAGRTVLYSSLTVAAALSCLLLFPLRFLYSMGIGGLVVVLCAGAVSLVVLPSLLFALGSRIDALAPARLQFSAARVALPTETGRWSRLARAVMRRPGFIGLITMTALVLVALPALGLKLTPADARALPAASPGREVAETLSHDYGADGSQTITLVVHAPQTAARYVTAIANEVRSTAAHQARLADARYLAHGVWEIELLPDGTFSTPANQRLVKRLRALVPPPATHGSGRAQSAQRSRSAVLVGGATAWFIDQKSAIAAHTPLTLAILGLVTGGLLFLMTGSVILPVVALAMNLLTVAVGAGILVLIFQDGHLSSLLGFSPLGGLDETNLVLLFIVAFALSTDYGVFLFARIKEAHDEGAGSREAVARGLERTGRLITAAGLLFCVAIGSFATAHIFFVKQFGVGAALAVAIDATVVRGLLLPAIMGRLGERAWWSPKALRRLHARIGLSELASPASAE